MYGKCGSLDEAQAAFQSIEHSNPYSFNIIITAYAQNGHIDQAAEFFHRYPELSPAWWNTMISSYAQSGRSDEYKQFFDRMPRRDLISWNAIMQAVDLGLSVFRRIPARNILTWNTLLAESDGDLQTEVFAAMPEKNEMSWATLLQGYALEGHTMHPSENLFHRMPMWNVVACTAMITGYAQRGHIGQSEDMFRRMPEHDTICCNAMIAGFAAAGRLQPAMDLFSDLPLRTTASWNAMIAAFAENGDLAEAARLFHESPRRDLITWNTMIGSFALHGEIAEAKWFFDSIPRSDTISLNAMGICRRPRIFSGQCRIGPSHRGTRFWSGTRRTGTGSKRIGSSNRLRSTIRSRGTRFFPHLHRTGTTTATFELMPERNSISWNAMIATGANLGEPSDALEVYKSQLLDGFAPNHITFTSVFQCCAHLGLLDLSRYFFVEMVTDHRVEPVREHYCCIIDLLGRLGQIREAEQLVEGMPFKAGHNDWTSLLNAYTVHDDMENGQEALNHVLRHRILNPIA